METVELLQYFQMAGIAAFVCWVGAYIGIHLIMQNIINQKEKQILINIDKAVRQSFKSAKEDTIIQIKESEIKKKPVVIYSMNKKGVKDETTKSTVSRKG